MEANEILTQNNENYYTLEPSSSKSSTIVFGPEDFVLFVTETEKVEMWISKMEMFEKKKTKSYLSIEKILSFKY
jgi:hypothetical protein